MLKSTKHATAENIIIRRTMTDIETHMLMKTDIEAHMLTLLKYLNDILANSAH